MLSTIGMPVKPMPMLLCTWQDRGEQMRDRPDAPYGAHLALQPG
jgi:hypothetical protein